MNLGTMKRNQKVVQRIRHTSAESNAEILAYRPIRKDEAHSGRAEKS